MALSIYEKGYTIPKKPYQIMLQKVENMNSFVSPRFQFGAKNGSPASGVRVATGW